MKIIDWVLPQTPISNIDIAKVEAVSKRLLPEDFKNWLLLHNGSIPEPSELPLTNGLVLDINSFISFSINDTKENIFSLIDIYHDRLPDCLLPIADDGLGNYVCLRYTEDSNAPCVVFWDHEEADPNRAIVSIASSFTELLEILRKGVT